MLHRNILPVDNHPIISWSVADATALAALVLAPSDIGKVALQLSPFALLFLVDDSPATWNDITGAGTTSAAASTITVVDAGGYYTGTQVEAILQEIGASLAMAQLQCIAVACSDESTNLTVGTAKVSFHMPYKATLVEVFAGLTVAQAAGSIFTVDVNEAGVSILSTKLTIDNTELTSLTAATPPVISDAALAKGSLITIDIDQVGTALAKGLKVYMIVRQVP